MDKPACKASMAAAETASKAAAAAARRAAPRAASLALCLALALASFGAGGPAAAHADSPAALTDIVKATEPSVVGIVGKIGKESRSYDEMFDNIVIASGIVYRHNGYIITNHHVVDGCERVFAILSDKRVYEARVIGSDALSDVALIKIDKGMLKPAVFADSGSVEVGASVITIGTPLALDLHNTVGYGIISGVRRGNTGFAEYEFLQTDALANPGNSGGPLVDMSGRILGIIEGGYMDYQGINFVIPSETIQYVVRQLMAEGRVRRPSVGARLVQSLMADYGLPTSSGLYFTDVEAGGAAGKAGIRENDTLVSMGGVKLTTFTAYAEELKKYSPGDAVEMAIERDGGLETITLEFDEMREQQTWP